MAGGLRGEDFRRIQEYICLSIFRIQSFRKQLCHLRQRSIGQIVLCRRFLLPGIQLIVFVSDKTCRIESVPEHFFHLFPGKAVLNLYRSRTQHMIFTFCKFFIDHHLRLTDFFPPLHIKRFSDKKQLRGFFSGFGNLI